MLSFTDRSHRRLLGRLPRVAAALAGAAILLLQAAAVGLPVLAADDAEVIRRVERAVQYELAAKDLPAFSIALVREEDVVWSAGFGHTDEQRTVPATADTIYRVGSVSKLFTDLAVMQQVEAGTIDLDAPVSKLLPEFRPQGEQAGQITLRQLMSHRAGLVREPPVGNYFDSAEPTLQETIASLNRTALVYPPGTRVKYSNAGVSVAGLALEAACGQAWDKEIDTHIFRPLQMTSSSFAVSGDRQSRLATGWMWTYDGRRFQAPEWSLGTGPAGNLYSSVNDLSRFLVCVLNDGAAGDGRVISQDSLQTMTTPVVDSEGRPQSFGLGFHIRQLDGLQQIGHGGAVYGFSTQLEAIPERKVGVVAVCALDGANGLVSRITEFALRCLIANQQQEPLPEYQTTVRIPPERAEELRGTWQSGERVAKVSELAGNVWLRSGTLRQELRALASSGDIVTDDVAGFGTPVRLADSGELRIGDTLYTRMPDQPPAASPADWDGLIGEYGWDHNTLYILEDHGKLTALIEWFFYYPLTQTGPDEFQFPGYGLYHDERLKFVRGPDGTARYVDAAEVRFERREVGTREGETFRITPVRPVDELRGEALAATPPVEQGEFRTAELVEVTSLDPTIRLDIRYATTNNFTGSVFYRQPRAFLQRPAAEAVARVQQNLKQRGLGLLIHDAYRPWHVTRMFWDATPASMKDFVADPSQGSRHNRGCAVDLTLFDLATGDPIQMVAGYDEFSARSFPNYPGGTTQQRWYRELLRRAMEAEGFAVYEFEWWHFDYRDWRSYRIGNQTFEEILATSAAVSGSGSDTLPEIQRMVIPVRIAGEEYAYDGQRCWVHARAGVTQDEAGNTTSVVLTTQPLQLSGSDVFFELHSMRSADRGATWSDLVPQPPFVRRRIDEQTEMTVCDFVPQWHTATRSLLGIGQTVWYRNNRVMDVRPRATAWAVFDPDAGRWSEWQELQMPDESRFANCGAGSSQRYDLPNGEILLPVYFKEPAEQQFHVTVLRCRFDGRHLEYVEHGNEMTIPVKRGLYEPSLTKCRDRSFLTIRNDDHGYVTTSRDGLHFDEPKRWTFDDGTDLGNYNTQQHWVTRRGDLYLVYTRRGANNDHVFRHRAPLFIARVDPDRLCVVRATEQVLIPERGARLGNFGVTRISDNEVWVTVAEWMQAPRPQLVIPVDNPRGADNSIFAARLTWPATASVSE